MPQFVALVRRSDRPAFGISFPDVRWLFAAAAAIEDVVPSAADALSIWAETEEMPKPRTMLELQGDEEVAAELADGAFLVAVPFNGFSG